MRVVTGSIVSCTAGAGSMMTGAVEMGRAGSVAGGFAFDAQAANVAEKPRFAWPTFGYFGSERIAFLLVTRTEDNLRARGDKSANATFANSFASASDDHDFVPIDHVRFLQFRFAQKNKVTILAAFTRLARRVIRPVVLRLGCEDG